MEQFTLKTKVSFGDNALERLSQLPYRKVLIVTDAFIAKGDMIHLITKPLEQGGIAYQIFDDVKPDPPIKNVSAGVAAFLQYQPEALIAVGGGSSIDSGKGIKQIVFHIGWFCIKGSDLKDFFIHLFFCSLHFDGSSYGPDGVV
ncbi:MAG: iron-containing alcohol dehydrogenase, partial [Lachnospiraceae bacterium]|nr:iron-containing alcohol dehydrogenase [Lachnospiraceae bacterium]